ncbi:MAG: 50S ribosomal protein L25/general stress protein Ctc [Desulfovibrionaceae bacterium]|nr:50S ribosomal protein L25/general stress protein Ctc [Desulfovibrionaceae bacterium]
MEIEKTLKVTKRDGSGKGPSGRLRAEGLVPGVFYTAKGENVLVQAQSLPLEKIYESVGKTSVFNLEIDDNGSVSTYPVLIWQIQNHPYKKRFLHVDYYGVDLEKEVRVDVPIEFVGTAKGVKLGGVLETYHETLRLSSKPLDMPKKIEIDISDMDINATITVSDVKLPENVKAVFDQNYAVVSVVLPSKEDEAAEGEGAKEEAQAK